MMNANTEGVMSDDRKAPTDLKVRTKQFALRVVKVFAALPGGFAAQTLGKQVLRSGTSVGAHYREACRARSDAEFVSKIEGGLQELEEATYWLELIVDGEFLPAARVADLLREADELVAILTASVKTVKSRTKR